MGEWTNSGPGASCCMEQLLVRQHEDAAVLTYQVPAVKTRPVLARRCESPCRGQCGSPYCSPPPALRVFEPARRHSGHGARASRRQVAGLVRACEPQLCLVEGCGVPPSCNFPGLNLRLYCSQHREAGMVSVE